MKNAYVRDGVITEFLQPVEGFTLDECHHPDILENTFEVDDKAEIGWLYIDGKAVNPGKNSKKKG